MPPDLSTWLAPWWLQSTLLAGLGVALAGALPHVTPQVRLRWFQGLLPFAVGAPFVCAALLPITPQRGLALIGAVSPATVFASDVIEVSGGAGLWPHVLTVWLTGCLLRGGWLAIGALRLRSWRRETQTLVDPPFEIARRLTTASAAGMVTPRLLQPVTWGVQRPVVLVPDDLSSRPEAERLAIYVHELLHVARGDLRWVWVEEALRTVLWPAPAVWLIVPRLRLAREQVVDVETVRLTGAPAPYVAALVWGAERSLPRLSLVMPLLKRHQLLTRVASLTREVRMSRSRLIVSSTVLATALVAASTGVAALAPLVPGSSAPQADGPGPLERQAVLPTLDQPAPRRTFMVDPVLPAGAADGGASFRVHAVLDRGGAVAEVRIIAPMGGTEGLGGDLAVRQAVVNAVRQWQFEAPPVAPMLVVTEVKVGSAVVATPADGEAVRVGGAVPPPRRILNVFPEYPDVAKEAKVQGVVILEATIERTGDVSDLRILRSIPLLDAAALAAVRQWKYEPQDHRTVMVMTINFTLAADEPAR